MISKALRGAGFSGCISYICEKSDNIKMHNLVSDDWRKAASEMRAVASTNRTSRPVYHHILSFPIGERLDDEKMFLAAEKMVEKMGLADNQSVSAIHRDRDHIHVHTIVNQISFDGRAVRLDNDFHKRPAFAREIEKELDLQRYEPKKRDPNLRFPSEKIEQIRTAALHKNRQDFEKFLDEIGVQMNEKSSKSKALNYRFYDIESGADVPGSRIDSALSSPARAKAHFQQKTQADTRSKTTKSTTQKIEWDTSRNAALQSAVSSSKSWDALKKNLESQGLNFEIITRSNGAQGLVFIDENGNRIAASKVSSDLSHGRLEKRFAEPEVQPQAAPPPPPKQKSQLEQYSEARAEHFRRLGKSPEQIKVELENIKKAREKLWKEYKYKTSLIPQCFEPKYRGMMRAVERESFEKSKLRLEKQAQHLRSQRFPRFDDWKSGAIKPTPKPQKPTLFDKLKAFFFPIASASEKYHQRNTYHQKPQSSAIHQIEIISNEDFNPNDILKEASSTGTEQLKVVSSNYSNQLRPSIDKSTRSNHYAGRNHDQR